MDSFEHTVREITSLTLRETDEDRFLRALREGESLDAQRRANHYAIGTLAMLEIQRTLLIKISEIIDKVLKIEEHAPLKQLIECMYVLDSELEETKGSFMEHANKNSLTRSEEVLLTVMASTHVMARKMWELFRPQ